MTHLFPPSALRSFSLEYPRIQVRKGEPALQRSQSLRRNWPFLFFICLALLYTWHGLFGGKFLLIRDLQGLFHPWSDYKIRTIAAGQFPLWNPYSLFGQPFLANPQTNIFYPLSYIHGLIPFSRGITLYVFVQLMIGAAGMYWFSRELGLGRGGAALSGLTFAFGGWTVKMWEFASLLGTATWAPFLLALTQRSLNGKPRWLLIAGPVVLSMQIFAGYPTIAAFTLLAAWWLIAANVISRRIPRSSALISAAALAGACALAVVLSLIQIVPTAELASLSTRATPTYQTSAAYFSLHPAELGNFLIPYLFGFPDWQKCFYLGVLPLILAFFAFGSFASSSTRREKRASLIFSVGVIVLAIPLALGKHTPVYEFLCRTIKPLGGLLNWPSLTMFLAFLGACTLAGLGLDELIQSPRGARNRRLLIAVGIFLLAGIVLVIRPGIIDSIRQRYGNGVLAFRNPAISPMNFPPWLQAAKFLLLSLASCAILLIAARLPARKGSRIALVLALSALDLWLFARGQLFFSQENTYARQPAILSPLPQESEGARLARLPVLTFLNDLLYGSRKPEDFLTHAELIPAETGLLHSLSRTYGWDSLATTVTMKFSEALNRRDLPDETRFKLLRMVNAAHLMLPDMTRPDLAPSLLPVPDFLPRAFFVRSAWYVEPPEQALDTLLSPEFDPEREVILLADGKHPEPLDAPESLPSASVNAVRHTANTVSFRYSADREGFIFLSDAYYPGWRAYVNGEGTEVLRANYAFRAVRLPPGQGEVIFIYKPAWLLPAALASGIAWLLFIFFSAWILIRRKPSAKALRSPG